MAAHPCIYCDIGVPHALRLCSGRGGGWLDGYAVDSPDPARARMAWRGVVRLGCEHPPLALCVGAAIGSVLMEALDDETFILRLVAPPRSGKTMALRTAMAAAGLPEKLVRPAGLGAAGLVQQLEELSILPVAIDDLDSADLALAETILGEEGSRSTGVPRWRLVVLAAGTEPCVGLAPHTVNLPFHVPSGPLEQAHTLAAAHAGWPLRRLRGHPLLSEAQEWYGPVLRALERGASSAAAQDAARHLAVCAVGLGVLGRLVGHGLAAYAGVGAALEVVAGRGQRGLGDRAGQRNRSASDGRTRSTALPSPGSHG